MWVEIYGFKLCNFFFGDADSINCLFLIHADCGYMFQDVMLGIKIHKLFSLHL